MNGHLRINEGPIKDTFPPERKTWNGNIEEEARA